MPSKTPPAFRPLTGIYEPSAIQQLADGRFLVVEDEQQRPFSLVSINMAGEVDSTLLEHNTKNETAPFWKWNDLEGLTADAAGYVYAITSHCAIAIATKKNRAINCCDFVLKLTALWSHRYAMNLNRRW